MTLPTSDPYIFQIKVDFSKLKDCEQTHHPVLIVVQNRRHVSHNNITVGGAVPKTFSVLTKFYRYIFRVLIRTFHIQHFHVVYF